MNIWDVVVVGTGPAGCAAAIAARHANPSASVLMLDRSEFPRDKCCGDAIVAAGLTALGEYGVDAGAVTAGYPSSQRLRLIAPGGAAAARPLPDPITVIPRKILDTRLVTAAQRSGAVWRRHTVRQVRDFGTHVDIDGAFHARMVVGADGAESTVRRAIGRETGRGPGQVAVAIRGYDRADSDLTPTMVLDERPGLAYAWRFPSTAGPANAGYGHQLVNGEHANRTELLCTLRRLLPAVDLEPRSIRAHRLPLSTSRQQLARGRLLLVGDAASLVNPISGEGIYYAIASGLSAGTAAAAHPHTAAARYRAELRRRFGRHHRHVAIMSRLTSWGAVTNAAVTAAQTNQRTFDDIADLGLAAGVITPRLMVALTTRLAHIDRLGRPRLLTGGA